MIVCTDDNECEYENGGCVHYCHNTYGNYSCSCLAGFQLHRDAHDCIGQCACVFLCVCLHLRLSLSLSLCELGLVSESLSRQSVCLSVCLSAADKNIASYNLNTGFLLRPKIVFYPWRRYCLSVYMSSAGLPTWGITPPMGLGVVLGCGLH